MMLQQPPAVTTNALGAGRKMYPALHLQAAGKLAQQTPAAAHTCITATGRIFITDKSNKQRFLTDTGSHLCVFPRKLIPRLMESAEHDLCTANDTTIPTY
jgi:hypothetical protein